MSKAGVALGAAAAGAIFAIGLGISGMTRPAKVVAFLDVGGDWDPSLAFVMVGAIGVYAILCRLVLRREAPALDSEFHLPAATEIDWKLLCGATLFGLGWGLAGYCPGPAIASLVSLSQEVLIFVGSMAAGMALWRILNRTGSAET
jgi:uncharacterized membrane protein YedE/YeeE